MTLAHTPGEPFAVWAPKALALSLQLADEHVEQLAGALAELSFAQRMELRTGLLSVARAHLADARGIVDELLRPGPRGVESNVREALALVDGWISVAEKNIETMTRNMYKHDNLAADAIALGDQYIRDQLQSLDHMRAQRAYLIAALALTPTDAPDDGYDPCDPNRCP